MAAARTAKRRWTLTKVPALSPSLASRSLRRTTTDPALRPNAILLHGPPVAHLPTGRIFDYAAHFDIHPLGLEWVDDNTCVFVFASKAQARSAFLALQKPTTTAALSETPPSTELIAARAIPISLWPPEDRIHHSLGVGQGLKETIHMRWARVDDKKKRGAKKDSAFYRKHGQEAGKESAGFGVVPASVTVAAAVAEEGSGGGLARRLAPAGDTLEERIAMDGGDDRAAVEGVREWDLGKPGSLSGKRKRGRRDEVDEFLGEDLIDDEPAAPSPPSKMRSDYIAQDGRTATRTAARLPRRARGRGGQQEEGAWLHEEEDTGSRRRGGRRRGRNRGAEPVEPPRKKTREELDMELDAFLNDRD